MAAYASEDGVLTEKMVVMDTCLEAIEKHKQYNSKADKRNVVNICHEERRSCPFNQETQWS